MRCNRLVDVVEFDDREALGLQQPGHVVFSLPAGQYSRLITPIFLHFSLLHIVFNMLVLWMFGVELERMWGSRFFTKYYFVCGLGAAATTIVYSIAPASSSVRTTCATVDCF